MANQRLGNPTPATPVAIATVERGFVEAYYHGSTNLTASEEAVVVARTQGVVEALFVEEGDVVEAGQPLAQLETERLALEVARSKVQLANLLAAYERAEQLHEARMVSPNEYDTARFNYQAEATNLQLREYELREATIRATIGGVITRRHVKVGYTLSQNEPAFEMKRLDTIEAELNIPEREIGRIRSGQYARVLIDALADQRFEGNVQRVAPEVDPASGTFRATVVLDNDAGLLKPGMFARVQVRTDRRDGALTAPLEAVVALRDKSSLFVVADGVAERRSVTTGYVSDGVIEILTGAEEGEQVVMTGQDGLRDGSRVTVVDGYSARADS
jgi:RND family efflux transporter MFP subunit